MLVRSLRAGFVIALDVAVVRDVDGLFDVSS